MLNFKIRQKMSEMSEKFAQYLQEKSLEFISHKINHIFTNSDNKDIFYKVDLFSLRCK